MGGGQPDVGEALGWPFRDPRWPGRLLGMGAIWLLLSITCIGAIPAFIAVNGWMLTAADNVDSGRAELPPPGLYLRRGFALFVVQAAYLVALVVVAGGLAVAAYVVAARGGVAAVLGGLVGVSADSLAVVASVALAAALPILAVETERRGVRGGFAVGAVVAAFRSDPGAAVLLGLISLLALDIISPLGAVICGVGLAATTPYAYAVLAAAVSARRRQLSGETGGS